MDARLHDILNKRSKSLDKLINEYYSGSYMNNTKWYQLIDLLTNDFDKIYMKYKLIYDDVVNEVLFNVVDSEPYFIEPILYKELEWIEIPMRYEYWKNIDNLKAGKKSYEQNIKAIPSRIESIGQFRMDEFDDKLKIYGYI